MTANYTLFKFIYLWRKIKILLGFYEEHSAGGKDLTVDEVREIHIKLKTAQKEFHDCYRILQSLRTQVWGD